jgi:hypothetical protein
MVWTSIVSHPCQLPSSPPLPPHTHIHIAHALHVSCPQILNIAGNDLGALPSGALSPLVNLHVVDLSGCSLVSVAVDTFNGLQRLQTLLLPFNNLTSLACLGVNGAALPSLRVRARPVHVSCTLSLFLPATVALCAPCVAFPGAPFVSGARVVGGE